MIHLKKEDNLKKNKVKKLVDENKKLNSEIGQLQFDLKQMKNEKKYKTSTNVQ